MEDPPDPVAGLLTGCGIVIAGACGYASAVSPLLIRERLTGSNCGLFALALLGVGAFVVALGPALGAGAVGSVYDRRGGDRPPVTALFVGAYAGGLIPGAVLAVWFIVR